MLDPFLDVFVFEVAVHIEVIPHPLIHVIGWLNASIPFTQLNGNGRIALDRHTGFWSVQPKFFNLSQPCRLS